MYANEAYRITHSVGYKLAIRLELALRTIAGCPLSSIHGILTPNTPQLLLYTVQSVHISNNCMTVNTVN